MAEVLNASSQAAKKSLTWEMAQVPFGWDKSTCPLPRPDAWSTLGPKQQDRFLCGKYVNINIPSNGGGVWPMLLVGSWIDECGAMYFRFTRQINVELMGILVRAQQPRTLVASTALY